MVLGIISASEWTTIAKALPQEDIFLAAPPVPKSESVGPMGTTADGLKYEVYSDHVVITDYSGSAAELVIPEEIEDLPVTSIGDDAFSACRSLTSITIPSSVTNIGDLAFNGCHSLTNITIPDSVTDIGIRAFWCCCSLTSIEIPIGVTSISSYAFYGCSSLTSIEIPSGVTCISNFAFYGCSSLTSITIPSSVVSIGDWAFMDCLGFSEMRFMGNAPSFGYDVYDNVTAIAYYPSNDSTWTDDVMQDYGGTITWVPYTDPNSTPNNGTYTSPQESVWYDIWCAGVSRFNAEKNFDLNVGDQTYPTGDSWKARADIPVELADQVSISKNGWITCQIPRELV